MTQERWRYFDSGPLSGAENMAIDEAMLESYAAGETPPSLRVYAWRPPAVSLGRFQRLDSTVDLAACRRLGIDVVRRPTGGRAILHTSEEVTFSIVVSAARLEAAGIMECYRSLAKGIIAGLHLLGLEARLVEREGPARASAQANDPACFAIQARCDLAVGGAKLVGSAQVQRRGLLLQQNSLPLRIRPEDWRDVFRRADSPPEALGLWGAARRAVPYHEVAQALRQGFADEFGIQFEEAGLTDGEEERARRLVPVLSLQ